MKTKSFFANFLMMATLVACNSTTPKQDSTVEKTDSAKETATSNNPASVEKVVFEVVSTLQKENIKGKVKKIDFFEDSHCGDVSNSSKEYDEGGSLNQLNRHSAISVIPSFRIMERKHPLRDISVSI